MNRSWKERNAAKERLAAEHARLIRSGLRKSVSPKEIVTDFLNAHFDKEITTKEARAWAKQHVKTNSEPLKNALRVVYSEGFALGQDIAANALLNAKVNKALTPKQVANAKLINWKEWKAGNKPAALLVKPEGAFAKLLDSRGVTLVGINGTTLDRIGTILAYGLQKGLPPKEIAPNIQSVIAPLREQIAKELQIDVENLISDSERALNIAQTETTRAVEVAARELYSDSGVELVEWLVAEGCDDCQENADASPISIDAEFPTGDTEPPAHPNCMCALAPYVVDTKDIGDDLLDLLSEE